MRKLTYLLGLLTAFFLTTSCLEIEEIIRLRADGSGTHTTTIDLGEMLANPFMQMGVAEAMKEEGAEMSEGIDSTISLYDELAPHNPQWSEADAALVKSIDSRIVLDFEDAEGMFTTSVPFQDLDQLERIQRLLREANEPEGEDGEDANPFGGMSGNLFISDFTLSKRTLDRSAYFSSEMLEELNPAELDAETMDLMKGMFSEASVTNIIEFPGKIKKVEGFPGHETDGNRLTVSFGFLELLESPEAVSNALTGSVKFKKR